MDVNDEPRPGRVMIEVDQFIADHLKIWKSEGIPAPLNELQSIQAWLSSLGHVGEKETAKRMRMRMLLLMTVAKGVHNQGEEAEDALGIYENRSREEVKNELDAKNQKRPTASPTESQNVGRQRWWNKCWRWACGVAPDDPLG